LPFLAYVHAHEPDPPEGDGRAPWEPNWRLWRWVAAAIGVAVAAALTSGALEALLVLVVFGLCCRAALELMPDDGGGLREWKQ
jgi:hypothetical protein